MTINHSFASDLRAEEVSILSKEILGNAWIVIEIISLKVAENYETARAVLEAKLIQVADTKPSPKNIQGEGVGLVDACFDAMIRAYGGEYVSLDTISIVDFTVNAHVGHGSNRKSDAKVTAILRVKNADDHEYSFQCTTSSISHSSVAVVQESIAFFINAELAYKRLHFALKDAESRNRNDLVTRYQHQMTTLVHATSYEKLVATLRQR